MSPNKLFDYLDGNLPPDERERLEAQIASNPVLRRELAIARKLHEDIRQSSEILESIEPVSKAAEGGANLARRIALAAIILVFLNVLIGIFFVFKQEKKRPAENSSRAGIRQQVEESVQRAAASALPLPSIESDEIRITTSVSENEAVADKTVAAAQAVGGSGAKALRDETGIVVLIDIPKTRESDFRDQLVKLGAQLPTKNDSSISNPSGDRRFLQIRIVKSTATTKS